MRQLTSRGRTLVALAFSGLAIGGLARDCPAQDVPITPGMPQLEIPRMAPADRSTRQPGHHPVDEVDRPDRRHRSTHRGFETRSRHFTVVSTGSSEEAEWLSEELERFWNDEVFPLADGFTDAHRQFTFSINAVEVFVSDKAPGVGIKGPQPLNYDPDIWVNLQSGGPGVAAVLPRVRAQAWKAFLRQANFDQRLPDWVKDGFASYFAGEKLTQAAAETAGNSPAPNVAALNPASANRMTSDRIDPGVVTEGDPQGKLWTRFLIESNDSGNLPNLLAAMAASTQGAVNGDSQEQLPWFMNAHGGARPAPISGPEASLWSVTNLAPARDGKDTQQQLAAWLKRPRSGQPVLDTRALDPELVAPARDAVVLLKLARRFAQSPPGRVEPKVIEFGKPLSARAKPSNSNALPADFDQLVTQLELHPETPWATIDSDGRPLLWYERERIGKLIRPYDGSLRTAMRDGHTVIERTTANGAVLQLWLETNPKDPQRPTAHVARVR